MIIKRPGADEVVLIAMRHAESESNVACQYVGRTESRLSARGLEQAEALGHRLSSVSFDVVYSSDLGRAARTAQAITRHRDGEPVLDARLRERHYGVLEGLGYEHEVQERYPEVIARLDSYSSDYVIPTGESAEQVRDRVASFVDDVMAAHIGKTVLVVAHGGVVRALFWHLLDLPYRAVRRACSDNASVSAFRYSNGMWNLELWNDTGHLLGHL